jgi:hypothetical protein
MIFLGISKTIDETVSLQLPCSFANKAPSASTTIKPKGFSSARRERNGSRMKAFSNTNIDLVSGTVG